jgi:hypothetical protein
LILLPLRIARDGTSTTVDPSVVIGTILVAGAVLNVASLGSAAPQTTHFVAESSEIVSQFGQRTVPSSGARVTAVRPAR